ncbi:uncharacterized protein LOC124666728 [Lolium rigidum]|uniref:uncharacterized protein LOC124666728 n=1 Tax=Lolium rigidum TaxID=89674 RepID=UPI001F5DC5FD|nr:uncharacterized protein LOC124666728 [Lolium rigidum]
MASLSSSSPLSIILTMAAITKKNRVFLLLFLLLAVLVVDAQLPSGDDDAKQVPMQMEHDTDAFPVPASCYSNYFPHCTKGRCKQFCAGHGKPPVPRAFCNDNSNCCCPVS